MLNRCLVRGRLNILGVTVAVILGAVTLTFAAQQQVAPTISVTVNKSTVLILHKRLNECLCRNRK